MFAIYGVVALLVVTIILVINGIPSAPSRSALASGLGGAQAPVGNMLEDGDFASGGPIANGWLQEQTTAGAPVYLRPGKVQEIAYTGTTGDTGLKRKIEVFQAIWKGIKPGQRWSFSIDIRGEVSKSYTVVGMEWFSVFKHTVGSVIGYGYHYIGEHDVYPPAGPTWQRVTVISPPLPTQARCLAVYVQLPEINSATKVDIEIRIASLGLVPGGLG
jgi:hypothetical protein